MTLFPIYLSVQKSVMLRKDTSLVIGGLGTDPKPGLLDVWPQAVHYLWAAALSAECEQCCLLIESFGANVSWKMFTKATQTTLKHYLNMKSYYHGSIWRRKTTWESISFALPGVQYFLCKCRIYLSKGTQLRVQRVKNRLLQVHLTEKRNNFCLYFVPRFPQVS